MIYAIIFLALVAWLVYRRYLQMSVLRQNGIKGPKPNLITGNLFTHIAKPTAIRYQEYLSKYGSTCGYYMGSKPNVVTTDIDLVRRIQIKDFNKFSDRQNFGLKNGLFPNPSLSSHIINEKGGRWKEMRTILNPTFSALKLKTMTPTIENAIDIFISKVDKQARQNTEFNIYDYFQLLTTDVIAKTALGLDTNVQHDPDNEFFKAAQKIFSMRAPKLFLIFMCFPELDIVFYPLRRFFQLVNEAIGNSPNMIISRLVNAAITIRQQSNKKINDLLQLMLDTKVSEDVIKNESTSNLGIDMSEDVTSSENKVENGVTGNKRHMKTLTHNQIVANAIIFYEAGYETTSTALGFIAHILVTKPDIQENIRQEVIELYEKEKKFDYNTVNKLNYMQMVIDETLRYYPPVTSFVTRNANEDYVYKNITIPKGATVRIPTYEIHHSEENWPNHDVFDPERFRDRKNIDPITFQPFGTGPRNCIGMRFALYEIKLALAKLLFNYQLVPGPSTEKELTVEHKSITETPKYGVFVRAVPLNNNRPQINDVH